MATHTTGAEFKRFYADPVFWPGDAWHEDVTFLVDGKEAGDRDMSAVEDSAKISIDGGIVLGLPLERGDEPSVETHFKRWRKLQTTKTLVVEIGASKLEALLSAVKAAGGKVIAR